MTDGIGSAEGKRRGCAFINLSNEDVPPYACMMMVAPPDKRANPGASSPSVIYNKATGIEDFGFEVDNEFGVYIDKCDLWGQLMQDPSRFVFNSDITVPPGGTGYCSFGEYPVRTNLTPRLAPFRINLWDGAYFAATRDSWYLTASGSIGAFRFFGKSQERSLMVWVTPNPNITAFYSLYGQFTNTGIEIVPLTVDGNTWVGVPVRSTVREMFTYPSDASTNAFRTPITLNLPGVYVMQYKGTANAYEPEPADTTIPYEYEIETSAIAGKYSQLKGSGILKKVSDGYSSYWPSQEFEGSFQVAVQDTPVTVRLKQTLTEKVTSEGYWRIVWDKQKTAGEVNWFDASVNFGYPWWVWGDGIR